MPQATHPLTLVYLREVAAGPTPPAITSDFWVGCRGTAGENTGLSHVRPSNSDSLLWGGDEPRRQPGQALNVWALLRCRV